MLSCSGVIRLNALESTPKFGMESTHKFGMESTHKFSKEKGQMIGFVAGDPRPNEGISWIATICVLPEFRGKGIGRALLEACENALPTKIIHLCVRTNNEEAIRMYKMAGYYNIDRWPKYYNDGSDSLVMEKLKGMENTHKFGIEANSAL